MSIEILTATQVIRLRKANLAASKDQKISANLVRAWRIGNDRIAWVCPCCRGLHISGEPVLGDDNPMRVGLCMAAFEGDGFGDDVRLQVMRGRPPQNIAMAIAMDYRLANLAVAYDELTNGRVVSWTKLAAHVKGDREDFRVPSKQQVLFALSALAECGALDEARALRQELAGLTGRKLWRAAAADFWRRQVGLTWRDRLLRALRQCWLQHGGPV